MKNVKVRGLVAEGEPTFEGGVSIIESAIKGDVPITDKDKTGGLASDAEILKMGYLETQLSHFVNHLSRSFDEVAFFAKKRLIDAKLAQIGVLSRLITVLQGQIIVLRVEIKTEFGEVKKAVNKSAAQDASLKYLSDSVAELYEKSTTKTADGGNKGKDKPEGDKPKDTPQ